MQLPQRSDLVRAPRLVAVSSAIAPQDGAAALVEAGPGEGEHALAVALRTARARGVPLVLAERGAGLSDGDVRRAAERVADVARRERLQLTVAAICAQTDPAYLAGKLADGRIRPAPEAGSRLARAVEEGALVTAAMGAEPLAAALEGGADVIVAGHCVPGAAVAAVAIAAGFDRADAWHMGVLLSDGGEPLTGALDGDGVKIAPADPGASCSPSALAARSYEAAPGGRLAVPGGELDVRGALFAPADAGAVRIAELDVRGARFAPADAGAVPIAGAAFQHQPADGRAVRIAGAAFAERPYTVELHAARAGGARALGVVALRDDEALRGLDSLLAAARAEAVRTFGRDAAVRVLPRDADVHAAEDGAPASVGVVVEAVADTADAAMALCAFVQGFLAQRSGHGAAPRHAQAVANAPFRSSAVRATTRPTGQLLELDDPLECFRIGWQRVGTRSGARRRRTARMVAGTHAGGSGR